MKLANHNYFEILALLIALISYRKLKKSLFIWFIPFLSFIVIIELIGKYVNHVLKQHNAWLYNISVPIEYIFYALIFLGSLKLDILKRVTTVLIYSYIILTIATLLIMGVERFNSLALLSGNLVAISICCFYFYELLYTPKKVNLISTPLFWIGSGLLLFNLGELVYSTFHMALDKNWDYGAKIFRMINNQLLLLLYTCIAIGLLCVTTSKTLDKTSAL